MLEYDRVYTLFQGRDNGTGIEFSVEDGKTYYKILTITRSDYVYAPWWGPYEDIKAAAKAAAQSLREEGRERLAEELLNLL